MTIRAVLLDVGETLITPCRPLAEQFTVACGDGHRRSLEVAAVRRCFEEVWREREASLEPGQERYRTVPGGSRQYWREVLTQSFERAGAAIEEEQADELYDLLCRPRAWRPFPEVEAVLTELRSRGVRLAVASNWDRRLPELLDGLGLAAHFEHLGVSELVGHEKPSSEFFAAILAALELPAQEVVHVGDRLGDDVEGARGAGLSEAFLIDRRRRHPDAPWVLRSLRELPDCLNAL